MRVMSNTHITFGLNLLFNGLCLEVKTRKEFELLKWWSND